MEKKLIKVALRIQKGVITRGMNIPKEYLREFRMPIFEEHRLAYIRDAQTTFEPLKTKALVFAWDGETHAGTLPLLDLKRIDFV